MTFAELIGMLFAALGAGIVVWSLWSLVQVFASRKWEAAESVVLASDLQRSRDTDGGLTYRPEISYQYTAQGRESVASRWCFGHGVSLSWSGPAMRAIRRYPAGQPVLVYFDPHDPAEAVLERGINPYLFGSVVVGMLFLLLGIAAIVAG